MEALSDDPAEAATAAAGHGRAGAVIRVDSFEAARFRPRRMIKSIRDLARSVRGGISTAPAASSIDIIDAAGPRARCGILQRSRAAAWLERPQPVHADAGPEQNLNHGFGIVGALIKNKASMN